MRTTALFLGCALALSAPAAADSVRLQIGAFFPALGDDFQQLNQRIFTLEESDFYDATGSGAYVFQLGDHLGIGADLSIYDTTVTSAVRGVVDEFGFPVPHDTTLTLVPVVFDLRFSTSEQSLREGSVGFFGGVGAGPSYWAYEEEGFFTGPGGEVFFDRFRDSGVVLAAHALAGIEIPLGSNNALAFEGRYRWSQATLEDDLGAEIAEIDLSGFALTGGVVFRF